MGGTSDMKDTTDGWGVILTRHDDCTESVAMHDNVYAVWREHERRKAVAFAKELRQHLKSCTVRVARVRVTVEWAGR